MQLVGLLDDRKSFVDEGVAFRHFDQLQAVVCGIIDKLVRVVQALLQTAIGLSEKLSGRLPLLSLQPEIEIVQTRSAVGFRKGRLLVVFALAEGFVEIRAIERVVGLRSFAMVEKSLVRFHNLNSLNVLIVFIECKLNNHNQSIALMYKSKV